MADQVLYEVERLLGKKLEKKQVFYLVRWKNYPPEYDTWEPAKYLNACKLLFSEFDKKHKSTKSASVAAKLLKRTKVISKASGDAAKIASGAVRKKSQLIARQKIAAELKSKTKNLTQSGTVSNNKKLLVNSTKAKHLVKLGKSAAAANMARKSKKVSVKNKTKQNATLSSVKQADGSEENKKKVNVKKAGAKRASEIYISELKNQYEGDTKKPKQDLLDTSKTHSAKKSPKASKQNKEAKTDSTSKVKTPSAKSESPKESTVAKGSTKNKNSDSTEEHVQSSGVLNKAETKSPVKKKKVSKAKTTDYEVTIVSDSESDDDDVLYSLNDDVDVNIGWEDSPVKPANGDGDASVNKTSNDKSPPKRSPSSSASNKPSNSKKLFLMDFKKPKTAKQKPGSFEQLLRPSSPTPVFTPLKVAAQSPLREGSLLPHPHPPPSSPSPSSLTMDHSLVGDVPTVQPLPPGPLSPSTVSYRTILENLPAHFHPKGGKKQRKENGASTSSGASSGHSSAAGGGGGAFGGGGGGGGVGGGSGAPPIERRSSVRSVECVFRYKQIVVKKCHRYTQIWLNTQTTMKNAINPQVVHEVVAALNTAKYDDSCLVLFSGIGNFFCSGIDLHFLTTGDRRVAARQMSDALRELTKTFITFPKPVIAAVGGSAVGMGVSLLCLCDIVYASDKAAFHLPYAQLCQPPEGCSSFTLPLNLGLATANELLFGGRRITALEAYQLGLVSQVFWPTALMQEVIPRAQNMAKSSPRVLENTKLLIRSHHRTKLELTNETECNLLLEHWSSNECQHALQAYLADDNNFSH